MFALPVTSNAGLTASLLLNSCDHPSGTDNNTGSGGGGGGGGGGVGGVSSDSGVIRQEVDKWMAVMNPAEYEQISALMLHK